MLRARGRRGGPGGAGGAGGGARGAGARRRTSISMRPAGEPPMDMSKKTMGFGMMMARRRDSAVALN